MTSKALLRKRLGVAISNTVSSADFTWFFGYFCQKHPEYPRMKTAKELTEEQVLLFSSFCGYDLRFPIPLPLTAQI